MSCYHPLVGIWRGDYTDSGKKKYIIEGNLDPLDCPSYLEHVVIPCGHCIGCRLDYSRTWADRMMLELETSKKAVFLTLTYSPEALNDLGSDEHTYYTQFDSEGRGLFASVRKRDWQLFMKRFRRLFPDRKIRFYMAAEYGEKNFRPHMHAIIFGVGLEDFPNKELVGRNELGDLYYRDSQIEQKWPYGFIVLADVSWKTCAYVARYVTKKLNGPASEKYALMNCEKEFSLMSRKPGIGRQYLDEHPDCLDYQSINLSTEKEGLKIQVPKYFLRHLELTDPDRYGRMMNDRKVFSEDKMLIKLQHTGLDYLDYLETEELIKSKDTRALARDKCQ